MTGCACAALLVVVAGCRPDTRDAATPSASPGLVLERPEFSESVAGHLLWRVRAGRAAYEARGGTAALDEVTAEFHEGGRPVTRGQAPRATFNQAAHDLRLAGGLRLETLDGRAGVLAREARWDPASGRLETSGGVTFWQGPNRLAAERLWADRTLRRVELRGRVAGTLRLGPQGEAPR